MVRIGGRGWRWQKAAFGLEACEMTPLLSGGRGAPESRSLGRRRARGSEALPREVLEVSVSIQEGCLTLWGAWRPRAAGSAPPKGSLPSSVRRPSKGPAPFVCLNRMHNFQTPPLQWKFGSERVGVKNVKQDSITIFILEKPSSKYVYLIRTITAQEQKTD